MYKEIKNNVSVYIQNISEHKLIKDKLLGLVNECQSNPMEDVSNTDCFDL